MILKILFKLSKGISYLQKVTDISEEDLET